MCDDTVLASCGSFVRRVFRIPQAGKRKALVHRSSFARFRVPIYRAISDPWSKGTAATLLENRRRPRAAARQLSLDAGKYARLTPSTRLISAKHRAWCLQLTSIRSRRRRHGVVRKRCGWLVTGQRLANVKRRRRVRLARTARLCDGVFVAIVISVVFPSQTRCLWDASLLVIAIEGLLRGRVARRCSVPVCLLEGF